MTKKELIEALKKYPDDALVLTKSDDYGLIDISIKYENVYEVKEIVTNHIFYDSSRLIDIDTDFYEIISGDNAVIIGRN